MHGTTIAIDLAKSVFEVAVSQRPGRVCERRRLSRAALLPFLSRQPPATVLLEACGTAHFWARQIAPLGHRPVLLPPQHVRGYVRRNKTDRSDAKALLEAQRNEEIRPVPVKSESQQAMAFLHRMRSGWMATRTARINAVRGMLRELGVVIPVGARQVVPRTRALLEDPASPIPVALRGVLYDATVEIRWLEHRVRAAELELAALAAQLPVVGRLRSIPGIGLLTATALVAFVGDVQRFPSCRHFASYLGLTPRERSSGHRRRLGRISKQGDAYLRTLLTHGARSVLWAARRRAGGDRTLAWALEVQGRSGHNVAAVALANKLARIVWAVWRRGGSYRPRTS